MVDLLTTSAGYRKELGKFYSCNCSQFIDASIPMIELGCSGTKKRTAVKLPVWKIVYALTGFYGLKSIRCFTRTATGLPPFLAGVHFDRIIDSIAG